MLRPVWGRSFGPRPVECAAFMKSSPSTFSLQPTRPAVASLLFPLFIELSLGLVVGMVGTALAARISDAAGGGFALANHMFGLLFMLFRLVGAGVSVVITQNLGAGHRDEVDRVARAALSTPMIKTAALATGKATSARAASHNAPAPAQIMASR